MDKLIAMQVFNEVVKYGSFSRAAEHLNMVPSVVTRHVSALEKQLGSQLLVRTTRRLSLTERGEIYLEHSRQILDDVSHAEALVSSAGKAYSGVLKISAPVNFGLHFLPSLIRKFQELYPDIVFDLILSDEPVDFAASGRDLAITIGGNAIHSDTVTRELVSTRLILCASPQYLRQAPPLQCAEDLPLHRCIVLPGYAGGGEVWPLMARDGRITTVPLKPSMVCNTSAMAFQCALNDLGIAMLTCVLTEDHIRTGRLVHVLGEYEVPGLQLLIAYPSRRYLTSKARSFVEFLIARITQNSAALALSQAPADALALLTPARFA
ncbi:MULTISPECIES: LysR family transcriptional regulator [unclassified Undibacterium]|uniref:LysR family transcriptional regulator n=2 Tax=Bacteria TaxID=2 RepID=UPI002AC9F0AD|nr:MULTISPECIES: LysR substrate-binding domain-containing protein [unclassified Undibacterium]MEB0140766.1 LysR substrate-binding domain-containing protein [Undibacterium sp. CCC2.1]MEB0173947.1 LysR substrate-binding domain-containing protein [Undibacterium sp. CCC1.1]MEB0177735.1 LysR substrate-binding domain-containing protein [Undibacterium sp. CCC3.4]MEB0217135.1 LysR substrate-binding domain-containing protein [Undibacterium sp. 5I2]WPX45560.1 LysR substrate-binding domain-containing pro